MTHCKTIKLKKAVSLGSAKFKFGICDCGKYAFHRQGTEPIHVSEWAVDKLKILLLSEGA